MDLGKPIEVVEVDLNPAEAPKPVPVEVEQEELVPA